MKGIRKKTFTFHLLVGRGYPQWWVTSPVTVQAANGVTPVEMSRLIKLEARESLLNTNMARLENHKKSTIFFKGKIHLSNLLFFFPWSFFCFPGSIFVIILACETVFFLFVALSLHIAVASANLCAAWGRTLIFCTTVVRPFDGRNPAKVDIYQYS